MTAKAIQFSGLNNVNFTSGGVTTYLPLSNGGLPPSATEADVSISYNTGGKLTKLLIYVSANATTGTTTLRIRKNTSNGNGVVSIATLTTGFLQDTTNSDTVAVADGINLSMANAAGVGIVTFQTIVVLFAANSNTVARHGYMAAVNAALSTASTTFFGAFAGVQSAANQGTTENRFQNYASVAGTMSALYSNVVVNGRSSTSTVRSRVGGANGNMTLSITAGATGLFQDTGNSDTLAAGDLMNYSMTNGTGTGNIEYRLISTEFSNSSNSALVAWAHGDTGLVQAHALTAYISVGAWNSTSDGTETGVRSQAIAAFTASKLSVRLDSNNNNGTSTITLRANAADTTLLVSIGAGVSGRINDLVNTPAIALNDLLTFGIVTGGTAGNIFDLRTITFAATYASSASLKDIMKCGGVVPRPR